MKSFFESPALNYSLANEDTRVEASILPPHAESVLSVGGSGSRVIPLLARNPKKLTVVDISPQQISFIKMKLAALATFDHEQYRGFLGIAPQCVPPEVRKDMFSTLPLADADRSCLERIFEQADWAPFVDLGGWERTMRRVAAIVQQVLGRDVVEGLFECRTVAEQLEHFDRNVSEKRWAALIRIFSSAAFFNLALYRFRFPQMNVSDDLFGFYRDALSRALNLAPARENFFLQMLFLGRIVHGDGVPHEFEKSAFEAAKEGFATCEISFETTGLLERLRSCEAEFSFLSVSDVPSYFEPDVARDWLQTARRALRPGGLLIARYYRHIPGPADADGLAHVNFRHQELLTREWTQFYVFDVLERIA